MSMSEGTHLPLTGTQEASDLEAARHFLRRHGLPGTAESAVAELIASVRVRATCDSWGEAASAKTEELQALCGELLAAVWDAHYGEGLSLGYARSVNAKARGLGVKL